MKVIKKVSKSDFKNYIYTGFTNNFNDNKLYECLNSGKAINVFQMSAGTASGVVEKVLPTNITELTACNAFARPGTINSLPNYIDGKAGNLKYQNEIINSVFGETFGVCLYQEQIMKLFVDVGGHTDGGNYARGILKKLSKKDKSQKDIDAWNTMVEDLSAKAVSLGVPKNEINMLVDDISLLANYSFNKSHALAYSAMAALTLYMNVYMKKYYYPAVIEYAFDNEKSTLETLKMMRDNGFRINPPSLVTSKERTFSSGDDIFLGLHVLKSVGKSAAGICERGPYTSFRDFMEKNLIDSSVNKRAVTAIVEFGCFDSLEPELSRAQMIYSFNTFWERKPAFKRLTEEEIANLSNDPEAVEKAKLSISNKIKNILLLWDSIKEAEVNNKFAIKELSHSSAKSYEEKYLGFNFFTSPFPKEIRDFVNEKTRKGLCLDSFYSLRKYKNISKVVPVFIASVREYKDKNKNTMCFLTTEDMSGESVVIPIFASIYYNIADKISSNEVALMLLYNTDDNYHGGEQIMFGTKKYMEPEKIKSFIIPIWQEKTVSSMW